MINGFHVLTYSADPAADRAFLRDVLGFGFVVSENDSNARDGDWLIFKLPPAELGVHPRMDTSELKDDPPTTLHLMCDDISATVAELDAKGVVFEGGITDAGFGLVTGIRLPSGSILGLYQPSHPIAHSLPD